MNTSATVEHISNTYNSGGKHNSGGQNSSGKKSNSSGQGNSGGKSNSRGQNNSGAWNNQQVAPLQQRYCCTFGVDGNVLWGPRTTVPYRVWKRRMHDVIWKLKCCVSFKLQCRAGGKNAVRFEVYKIGTSYTEEESKLVNFVCVSTRKEKSFKVCIEWRHVRYIQTHTCLSCKYQWRYSKRDRKF